jgi:hypothetical protein
MRKLDDVTEAASVLYSVILSLWLISRVCVFLGKGGLVVVGEQFCESPVSICVITFRVAIQICFRSNKNENIVSANWREKN